MSSKIMDRVVLLGRLPLETLLLLLRLKVRECVFADTGVRVLTIVVCPGVLDICVALSGDIEL